MDSADGDFEAFVAARGPRLLRVAWLLTGDAHLAEGLLQSTLAKVWPKWSAVAVSLCVSGDAPWTVEAVRSMIAGADFDKDPGEDSRKGAEPVPVPAAEYLRNKK